MKEGRKIREPVGGRGGKSNFSCCLFPAEEEEEEEEEKFRGPSRPFLFFPPLARKLHFLPFVRRLPSLSSAVSKCLGLSSPSHPFFQDSSSFLPPVLSFEEVRAKEEGDKS